MKTVKIACSLLGIAGVCLGWPGCGNGAASASPEIETDTLIDLGKFPISRDTVFNVVYRNAGTEPLQIDRIETTCGCLSVVSLRPRPLAPGDTASVRLRVHPVVPGHFEQEADLIAEGYDLPVRRSVKGFGQMMIATRHGNFAVKKGDKLAGTRIIPLVIEEEKMEAAKKAAAEATGGCPILELKPFLHKKVGIVTTGNEVFYGRIKDTFTPVIRGKLSEFDTEVIDHVTWNDDDTKVTASILDMIQKGADVVVCTGGMSVDPDDKTPLAIRNTGADIVSYGAPVLPGAMFLLAYYQVKDGENPRTVAIMGLPGCVMYARRTIFDLVLPRIMADDQVTADDLAALGQGGLCLNCPECTFPNCGFGKGM